MGAPGREVVGVWALRCLVRTWRAPQEGGCPAGDGGRRPRQGARSSYGHTIRRDPEARNGANTVTAVRVSPTPHSGPVAGRELPVCLSASLGEDRASTWREVKRELAEQRVTEHYEPCGRKRKTDARPTQPQLISATPIPYRSPQNNQLEEIL